MTVAHKAFGWIDNETTTRALMVMFGIFLAAMGNSMPKQNDGPPSPTPELVAVRQSISRVGGWAMMIGGVIWAVLWTFAPRDFAEVGSVVAVVASVLVMLVYAIWRFRAHRRSSAS